MKSLRKFLIMTTVQSIDNLSYLSRQHSTLRLNRECGATRTHAGSRARVRAPYRADQHVYHMPILNVLILW